MRRIALLLAAIVLTQSACFGSFAALRNLWQFNKGLSNNKFVQWAAFLGLTIVPVYSLFALGDVLIFNSVEFWSGQNPVADADVPREKEIRMADGGTAIVRALGDRLWIERDGHVLELERTELGLRVHADGALVSEVIATPEGAELLTADGERLSFTAEELEAHGDSLEHLRLLAASRSRSCGGALAQR